MKGKSLIPQRKKVGAERAGKYGNKILENGERKGKIITFSPLLSAWEGEEASSAEPRALVASGATRHLQDRGMGEAESRWGSLKLYEEEHTLRSPPLTT